ncbi:MAG: galactonate dehydratase, partial [Rhodospirillales bacterium]|nr:galactonate dehydratase [Rhodospirillales bacterium]
MKITEVRTFVVDSFRANFVFVKVFTDAGISGVGEGTVEFSELALEAAIKEKAKYLIGKDPFEVIKHRDAMHRDHYFRTGVILRSAISAIEAALLDIKGKALGVPVYELLGGKVRDRIRCYANGWFVGAKTPKDFGDKVKAAVDMGFTALKWDPFGSSYMQMTPKEARDALECIEQVRKAAGPDIDLMIEGHGRFDVPTAIRFAKKMQQFDPFWFEEPTPPESIEAIRDVRDKVECAIAVGERYYENQRFFELVEKQAADYLQPDVCHVGGMTELVNIAAMANTRYTAIAPHNPVGPIANAMSLHLAAAIPNFYILETVMTDVTWRKDICNENVTMENGEMLIPDTPGLGIDIDEDGCLAHPYKQYALRHYIGTLTDVRPPGEEEPF